MLRISREYDLSLHIHILYLPCCPVVVHIPMNIFFQVTFTVCEISTGPTPMAREFPAGPVDRQLPLARLACGNYVVIKFVDSIY